MLQASLIAGVSLQQDRGRADLALAGLAVHGEAQNIMRRLKKACELALMVVGLMAEVGRADVILVGTPAGRPGDQVELSIVAKSGTSLGSIDILPLYDSFANALALEYFQPNTGLADDASGALCLDNLCSYFFTEGKSFRNETVLATWRFKVTSNAEDFLDPQDKGAFSFDLNILIDGQHMSLPGDQVFRVLAVPEPSSFGLTAAGILLLIVATYRVKGGSLPTKTAQPEPVATTARGHA